MPEKMRRADPRIRQTLNQISQNIESANIATQASLFTFSQRYISPCIASLDTCLQASCHPCFAARDDQRKSHRNPRRGRDDLAFDFYDDWNEEEGDWGNDELDRLLAGSDRQPTRQGPMSYGSRIARRKSMGMPKDGNSDPTIVPSSSMFGFLERLPWKFGARRPRYRPSAADLQENVGRHRNEGESPFEDHEGGQERSRGRRGRNRSVTTTSGSTTNSLSSRGDLFPSEDEDDAVPIDDEFAMVLARRNTGTLSDDHSSGMTRGKRPAGSRASTKTATSSRTKASAPNVRETSTSSGNIEVTEAKEESIPSLSHLMQEEDHLHQEEESQVERKRQAAQKLARQRGLSSPIEKVILTQTSLALSNSPANTSLSYFGNDSLKRMNKSAK